ncbi:tetratricopeptide repeat protein [Halomonas salifodinae]|uniref:tetratricopeptide repeat protein n=1 Tax=Halomonas salifodinae TaxID=438745 RepID=UPI0033B641C9
MLLAAMVLFPLTIPTAWALDNEAQAAKEEGMRLYGIRKAGAAIPHLEQAAEAGDVEAMYYLGEANRRLVMGGMSQAALEWYHQAAQQGDPHAMLRLHSGSACALGDVCPEGGDDWRQAALEATLPRAEAGDTEAMFALYSVYATLEDFDASNQWLMQAAEAGNVEAQNWLGRRTRGDRESYPDDTDRLEAAAHWFRRAAEADYVPAIHNLSLVLMQSGESREAWEWMQVASVQGHVDARLGVGWCYLEPERDALCQNEEDISKGVGILSALVKETNMGMVQGLIDDFKQHLDEEQLIESEAIAEQWLNHEPPLSYFPDKFGP